MDPSPPPYTEHIQHDQSLEEQIPQYVAPAYNQSSSDSKSLQHAMAKFPPAMNGYFQWKMTSTFHLGLTAEQKLFAVSVHASVFGNKPSLILYDGPTKEDPVLATLKSDKWGRARPVDLTLPPRPHGHHTHAIDLQIVPASTSRVSPTFAFETQGTGKGAGRERFEWRKTHGDEIKELATGHSYGWKLVWLSGPIHSAGGSRKEREMGVASDGTEIVALLAHNASWSMTKGFRFAFLATGLNGTFGETWEIMTVTSALHLWYLDFQGAMAAAAAS
ncbi:uncharacterized protein N7473_005115 [Penicillium subrubescens]|uniref:Uncharacterized protein n=1 Tax=Penicillium subrubescens TaxID=1316194 RepID=A0A1Q5UF63_9EURO|nr:uncharacterized protein N7473_005115 [Penicillium subrubescens]KAJ5895716.1 hypothetical protein N7473_005115 [Penicillium subrubescens]OKP11102.1 hypothetical protein PENSUB_3472 [Penicillium subrubescens]